MMLVSKHFKLESVGIYKLDVSLKSWLVIVFYEAELNQSVRYVVLLRV
jgi:hypothetical protein